LFRAATRRFPYVAVFHQGVGCCAGHERLHEEAIGASRRALELEPANARFMSDLGWSLLEARQLSEAHETLARAVAIDPDDELAKENLRLCLTKLSNSATPNQALQPTSRARGAIVKSRNRRRAARG